MDAALDSMIRREEKRLLSAFGEAAVTYTGASFAIRHEGRYFRLPFGAVTTYGIRHIRDALRRAAESPTGSARFDSTTEERSPDE